MGCLGGLVLSVFVVCVVCLVGWFHCLVACLVDCLFYWLADYVLGRLVVCLIVSVG